MLMNTGRTAPPVGPTNVEAHTILLCRTIVEAHHLTLLPRPARPKDTKEWLHLLEPVEDEFRQRHPQAISTPRTLQYSELGPSYWTGLSQGLSHLLVSMRVVTMGYLYRWVLCSRRRVGMLHLGILRPVAARVM